MNCVKLVDVLAGKAVGGDWLLTHHVINTITNLSLSRDARRWRQRRRRPPQRHQIKHRMYADSKQKVLTSSHVDLKVFRIVERGVVMKW